MCTSIGFPSVTDQGIQWTQASDSVGTKSLPISFSFPLLAVGFNNFMAVQGGATLNSAPGVVLSKTQIKISNDNTTCVIGAVSFGL